MTCHLKSSQCLSIFQNEALNQTQIEDLLPLPVMKKTNQKKNTCLLNALLQPSNICV